MPPRSSKLRLCNILGTIVGMIIVGLALLQLYTVRQHASSAEVVSPPPPSPLSSTPPDASRSQSDVRDGTRTKQCSMSWPWQCVCRSPRRWAEGSQCCGHVTKGATFRCLPSFWVPPTWCARFCACRCFHPSTIWISLHLPLNMPARNQRVKEKSTNMYRWVLMDWAHLTQNYTFKASQRLFSEMSLRTRNTDDPPLDSLSAANASSLHLVSSLVNTWSRETLFEKSLFSKETLFEKRRQDKTKTPKKRRDPALYQGFFK